VSCTGLLVLLSTGPYPANSGTSASCCAYADCVSAAVGGGGVADILFEAGTPIVSSVLGPKILVLKAMSYVSDAMKLTGNVLRSLHSADFGYR